MTNIEKMRQEIKRRYDYENEMYHKMKPDGRPNDGWSESLAIMGVLEELLFFINSLPEEPDSEELEEAAMNHIAPIENEDGLKVINFSGQDIKDAFKAGAEWQKEQMLKYGNVILAEEDFDAEKEKSMEWGYNLCKEQMLKKAVEGYVTFNVDAQKEELPCVTVIEDEKPLEFYDSHGFKLGDKVRIIIVKEEKK